MLGTFVRNPLRSVFKQGDYADKLYILLRGSVTIWYSYCVITISFVASGCMWRAMRNTMQRLPMTRNKQMHPRQPIPCLHSCWASVYQPSMRVCYVIAR